MIKFSGTDKKTGEWVAGFGLSEGNIRRLRKGEPIMVNLKEMGLPGGKIVIMWGPTEREMYAQIRDLGMIGPETDIRDQTQEHEQSG
jgi:hypothetical protein